MSNGGGVGNCCAYQTTDPNAPNYVCPCGVNEYLNGKGQSNLFHANGYFFNPY